jgi:hypothetical protein
MPMPCGRSDVEPSNQAAEALRAQASSRPPLSASKYYNRLEYLCSFGLLYCAVRSILRLLSALPHPPTLATSGTPIRLAKPQAFLSLVQGRQSCHQQLWGVTPFRRGIA